MPGHGVSLSIEDRLDILARQVAEKGEEIGLPYIAVSADISSFGVDTATDTRKECD